MPRGNGTGPQGLGPGTGRGKGRREFGLKSPFQKTSLGGTLFAFAAVLVGNWLDKKLSRKKSGEKYKQDEFCENNKTQRKNGDDEEF